MQQNNENNPYVNHLNEGQYLYSWYDIIQNIDVILYKKIMRYLKSDTYFDILEVIMNGFEGTWQQFAHKIQSKNWWWNIISSNYMIRLSGLCNGNFVLLQHFHWLFIIYAIWIKCIQYRFSFPCTYLYALHIKRPRNSIKFYLRGWLITLFTTHYIFR